MGSRGPAPKSNPVRRNKHEYATEIPKEAQKGRPLPRTLPVDTAKANEFWKTWSHSPPATTWLETDWVELEIVTKLVDEFYKGDSKLAGEIRQRTAKLGATVEDRARLRMSFEKKPEGPSEAPNEVPADVLVDQDLYNKLRAV